LINAVLVNVDTDKISESIRRVGQRFIGEQIVAEFN